MTTPQNHFKRHVEQSLEHIDDLKDEIERILEIAPRNIPWEHVGDVKHIELTLKALLVHIMGRTS